MSCPVEELWQTVLTLHTRLVIADVATDVVCIQLTEVHFAGHLKHLSLDAETSTARLSSRFTRLR